MNDCGAAKEKYRVTGQEAELKKKGYIGFDWQDESMSGEMHGYSYYRYFSASNKSFWIYAINNTGGSGEFDNIYLAKRMDANTLRMEPVAGGDRCNGGIQDVSEKGNTLSYSVNLTAYDVTDLAKTKLKDVKAYDDLAACAVCCVATARYQIDPGMKLTLNHVELQKVAAASELPDQGKYQACFNNLMMDYVKKNQLKLEAAALDTFVQKFHDECAK